MEPSLRYILHLIFLIPVFWLHSANGLQDLFYTLARFAERPDRIFSTWLRRVLTTVIPFGLMASFPARLFLEQFEWNLLLQIIGATIGLFLFLRVFWRFGLRSYSSASS